MGKRTPEGNRRYWKNTKRARPSSEEYDSNKVTEALIPDASANDADQGGEEYQHHSILRRKPTGASAKKQEESSTPSTDVKKDDVKKTDVKKTDVKRIRQRKRRSGNLSARREIRDSESDASVSDVEEASEKEVASDAFALTWRGGKENCTELSRRVVGNRDVAVFKLKKTGIPLAGSGWLRVVRGAASVLGAVLTANGASLHIVSAPLAPFAVTVVPAKAGKHTADCSSDDWLQALCAKFLSAAAVQNVACSREECIVLFAENLAAADRVGNIHARSADSDVPSSCKFYMRRAGLPSCSDGPSLVRGLNILGENDKLPCFSLWDEWGALTRKLSNFIHSTGRASDMRLLVCGASGTGKSMAVRCALNYLLLRHQEVVLIDTDVGQPEMNIAGLVAAHSVRQMRGGAAAASNRGCPIAGGFFGDITPRENPDLYADCIRRVVFQGRKYAEDANCPIVINSDGWVSGVGAELLRLVRQCASPSHVVAMTFADSTSAPGAENGVVGIIRELEMDRTFRMVSPLPARSSFYSGASLRDLHFATYFSAELISGRVRSVSIDDVHVETVGEPIESEMQFAALNACVVALACTEGRKGNVAEWNVRGFGIVRGVDTTARKLYVATPLQEQLLEFCDALVIASGIQLPSALFLAVAEMAAPWLKPPYLTANTVPTGGQMKSRASLHRRR